MKKQIYLNNYKTERNDVIEPTDMGIVYINCDRTSFNLVSQFITVYKFYMINKLNLQFNGAKLQIGINKIKQLC